MKNIANLHDTDLAKITGAGVEYGPDGAEISNSAMILVPSADILNISTKESKVGGNAIDAICSDITLSTEPKRKHHVNYGDHGNYEKKSKPRKFKYKNSK